MIIKLGSCYGVSNPELIGIKDIILKSTLGALSQVALLSEVLSGILAQNSWRPGLSLSTSVSLIYPFTSAAASPNVAIYIMIAACLRTKCLELLYQPLAMHCTVSSSKAERLGRLKERLSPPPPLISNAAVRSNYLLSSPCFGIFSACNSNPHEETAWSRADDWCLVCFTVDHFVSAGMPD